MVKYIDIYKAEEVLARQTWLNNIDLITAVGALKLLVPAADVVEVRHGRWIGYPECLKYPNAYSRDHIVCSVCEECFSVLDNATERFDFCPHCGAKMDEVEDKSECAVGCDGYCEECPIAENYNLEDDDSPCRDCGEEEDG